MRNLKALGLALIAVTAMGAVSVSSAGADEFTAESFPLLLTGKNDPGTTPVIKVTAGAIECKKTTSQGTLTGITKTASVTAAFSECTAFGFAATVEMNGCTFLYHLEGGASTNATKDIVCPAGKEITVKAASGGITKCIIHVPPQTNLTGITVKNTGAGVTREITGEINTSAVKYTHTKGTGLGACTEGSASNGVITSKVLITGEKDNGGGEHVGVFVS